MFYFVVILLNIIGIVVSVLLSVALLTVSERKFLSSIQRRRGPNVVGFFGLLQAIGDGVKLVLKETTKPTSSDSVLYFISPIVVFSTSLGCFGVLPFSEGVVLVDVSLGVLCILALSSLGVYGVLLGGYSSNSKYGFYGGISSSAQMISYEVSIGFILLTVVFTSKGSFNLSGLVLFQEGCWNVFTLLPMFILFVVSILAETNRHPFDLPEAESELVSGYNVEYSAGGFALFFLGEYGSIILMSGFCGVLFFGGWLGFGNSLLGVFAFSINVFFIICVFIWASAAFPSYRYDQLIELGWLSILPLALGYVMLTLGFVSVLWGFLL